MDIFQLEIQMDKMRYKRSPQKLKQMDQSIIMILNKARKKVEGISRNIPYSKEKELWWSTKLYQKYKVKQLQNKHIDEDILWKCKTVANIYHDENILLQEAKEEWQKAKEQ